MELQHRKADFEAEGIVVFAISYDPVPTLAAFAEKRGIEFDLLSDEGSRVIRQLGLLNDHVAEQHAHYGVQTQPHHQGIPYPGSFLLDENGIVFKKEFEQSYRVRPTARALVEATLGEVAVPSGQTARAASDEVAVVAWTDSPSYHPYQKLHLHFEVTVASGLHIYGQPVPEGLIAVAPRFEPMEGLEVGDVKLPAPHPFAVEGLDEEIFVYEGTVRGEVPIILLKNVGDITLEVVLAYQACTEALCYPPGELRFSLPLSGHDLIRD